MRYLRVLKSSISGDSNTPTDVYTPARGEKTLLKGILLCNKTASDVTATILIREINQTAGEADGIDYFIAKETSIPAKTTVEMIDGEYPVVHSLGAKYYDYLKAYASAADSVDIMVSLLHDVN